MFPESNLPNNNGKVWRKKWSYLTVVLTAILIVVVWIITNRLQHPPGAVSTPTGSVSPKSYSEQLSEQTAGIQANPKISFPIISKLSPVTAAMVPADVSALVLSDASQSKYSVISYENSKSGFYVVYFVVGSTVKDVWSREMSAALTNNWQQLKSLTADLFGLLELQNGKSKSQARISITQVDQNTEVIIQTLTRTQ